jgi:hypothetical protein
MNRFGAKDDRGDFSKAIIRSEEGTHDGVYLDIGKILCFMFDMQGKSYQGKYSTQRANRTEIALRVGSDRRTYDDKRKFVMDYIEITKTVTRRVGRPTMKKAANLTY